MKKEYLILVVVILSLSAYLVFKKDNRQNYTLPEPMKIEQGKIDKIIITRENTPVTLTRENKTWVVSEKFAADMTRVNKMLDIARNLKISGLISENKDTLRYELDEAHAIGVKIFNGKDLLLSFKIGKTAPSANHTFIMLAGDPKIYQADKNFKNEFDTSVDALRDKQILNFKEANIGQITLEKGGVSKILTAVPPAEKKEADPVSWEFEDGTSPDKEALKNLLSSLSFLKCEKFSANLSKENLKKGLPFCKITLRDTKPIIFTLFDKINGDTLVGTSSMSPYPFVLESYKQKDILSYVDKLAGLAKEAKE